MAGPWQEAGMVALLLLAGAAAGSAGALHVTTRVLQRLTALLLAQQMPPLRQASQAEAPATAGGGTQWVALPGNRMELGATGWAILLGTRPGQPLYWLQTPEGWPLTGATDLQTLKTLAERLAAERREFEPAVPEHVRAELRRAMAAASRRSN